MHIFLFLVILRVSGASESDFGNVPTSSEGNKPPLIRKRQTLGSRHLSATDGSVEAQSWWYKFLSRDEENAPTPEHINEEIVEQREENTLSCSRTNKFSSYVLVEHALDDPNNIDEVTLGILGEAFRNTYNKLNTPSTEDICDEEFKRLVEDVEVSLAKPVSDETDFLGRYIVGFIYKVHGRYDSSSGSKRKPSLFDLGDRRSYFRIKSLLKEENHSLCNCKAELNTIGQDRAPTEKEFEDAFWHNIKIMMWNGELAYVKSLSRVVEYNMVDCNFEETDFETEVIVQLTGRPKTTDQDALTQSFRDSYNDLAKSYCDPDYRHVTEVLMIKNPEQTDNSGKVEASARKKKIAKKLRKKKAYIFRTKGRCRGCKRKAKLFSKINKQKTNETRYLHELDAPATLTLEFDFRHAYDGKDECFCATHAVAARAPNAKEFAHAWNSTLAGASESGVLSNEIGVTTVDGKKLEKLLTQFVKTYIQAFKRVRKGKTEGRSWWHERGRT